MLLKFPFTKRKTPADFQSEYNTEFWRQARRALPWVLGVPALLLVILNQLMPEIVKQPATTIDWLFILLTYTVIALGLWFVIGPELPDDNEGVRTRKTLDALDAIRKS